MIEQFLSCDAPLVVEYLNAINRSSCPWCKSNDWSMITESSAMCVGEPALEMANSVRYTTPPVTEGVRDAKFILKPSDEPPSVYMRLRCNVCSCELRFDYFQLIKKAKAWKNNQVR